MRLNQPTGRNDGCVGATRYFECAPQHGVFVRADQCHRLPDLETETRRRQELEEFESRVQSAMLADVGRPAGERVVFFIFLFQKLFVYNCFGWPMR